MTKKISLYHCIKISLIVSLYKEPSNSWHLLLFLPPINTRNKKNNLPYHRINEVTYALLETNNLHQELLETLGTRSTRLCSAGILENHDVTSRWMWYLHSLLPGHGGTQF
ncbi:hypothetical protein LguiA_008376 [Lonicera macranthoides]